MFVSKLQMLHCHYNSETKQCSAICFEQRQEKKITICHLKVSIYFDTIIDDETTNSVLRCVKSLSSNKI